MSTAIRRVYEKIGKSAVFATVLENGTISLRGQGTYHKRHILAKAGGRWEAKEKRWIVYDIETAFAVNALFRIRVIIASYCHQKERTIFVTHKEAMSGVVRVGCGMCDRSFTCGADVEILEIVDKELFEQIYSHVA